MECQVLREIGIKYKATKFKSSKITDIKSAYKVIRKFYGQDINLYESAFVLLLNNSNTTIGYAKIGQGGVAGVSVDPKMIAFFAVKSLASAIIFAHNHPSGNLNASEADRNISRRIKSGLEFLDIKLLDSMIINDKSFSTVEY
jgi:DNA repair protein RadC